MFFVCGSYANFTNGSLALVCMPTTSGPVEYNMTCLWVWWTTFTTGRASSTSVSTKWKMSWQKTVSGNSEQWALAFWLLLMRSTGAWGKLKSFFRNFKRHSSCRLLASCCFYFNHYPLGLAELCCEGPASNGTFGKLSHMTRTIRSTLTYLSDHTETATIVTCVVSKKCVSLWGSFFKHSTKCRLEKSK